MVWHASNPGALAGGRGVTGDGAGGTSGPGSAPVAGAGNGNGNANDNEIKADEANERGLALVKKRDYRPAILEFQEVYRLSGDSNALQNIAKAHVMLGEPVQAVAAVKRVLQQHKQELSPEQAATAIEMRDQQLALLGQLHLTTSLPGADVLLDGTLVGRTPLTEPIVMLPGPHELTVGRAGYAPSVRKVMATRGGSERLTLNPEKLATDPSAPGTQSTRLSLRISEPGASVEVDGTPTRVPEGGLPVPVGPHVLKVERPGFLPYQREITLPASASHELRITLEPTEQTRYEHRQTAQGQRLRAYLTMGAGVLLTAGGGFLLARAANETEEAQAQLQEVADMQRRFHGQCYTGAEQLGQVDTATCQQVRDQVNNRVGAAETQTTVARVTTAAGIAVVLTGVALRLLGEDPEKYQGGALSLRAFGEAGVAFTAKF